MFKDQFFSYLQYEKRYSPNTILSYKKDLSQFSDFIESFHLTLLEVNHQIIRSWIVALVENGLASGSVSRKISSLRSFYKFLNKENICQNNPVSKIQSPKIAKKLPVFIDETKMVSLLDSPENFIDNFSGIRDKLIVELLFGTGIRLSELLGIHLNDFSLTEKTLKVLGKRNKERILPLNTTLVNLIDQYLNYREVENFGNNCNALIVINNGKAAYPKFIYRVVNKYLGYISKYEKKSPHILRHSFATGLLNNGADINAIKELLGHSNLAATQVYTHNSTERIKLIYKQAHPKA